jgi:retinol-binding protein 3
MSERHTFIDHYEGQLMCLSNSELTARRSRVRSGVAVLVCMAASAGVLAQLVPSGAIQPDMRIDARTKSAVLTSLAREIQGSYVFPDVADKLVKMLRERQAHGAYDKITSAREFGETLTKQMGDVAHDRHLRVIYSASVLPEMPTPAPGQSPLKPGVLAQQMRQQLSRRNYGFEKVERLRGNVGYLKFNSFADAEQGGDRIVAAMAWLADTDALILDLRDNGGGEPNMVQLVASYFFGDQESVHLNDLAYRRMGTREEDLTQWWTLPYLPGRRYVDREVYILTSTRTFSAAEELVYDLQVRNRATIVGETTGGGANDNDFRRLGDHYRASISIGHAINPVTHTNWEGKGIEPNVKVPKEQALQTAYKSALEHLIGKTQDEKALGELQQALSSLEAAPAEPR